MVLKIALTLFTLLSYSLSNKNKQTSHKTTNETKLYLQNNRLLYTVDKVVDGDTFWIRGNGINEKVRLIGIDAPESRSSGRKQKQYFGIEAKLFLKNYILNKQVSIELDIKKRDKYGRLLVYAYTKQGVFINHYLVENGYAVISTYPPNVKYQKLFYTAQQKAKEGKKGLWK
ncbi:thermonuclease family protein [Bergeyella sp. RCAD1439]|uniref:thermonuclease family protein n=1 Tax=Bergeyella anatis TaxID=3113737 RepID=UPI002E199375|nr:thermonuclease family protein [Bergeyella sp. RCAD1439]